MNTWAFLNYGRGTRPGYKNYEIDAPLGLIFDIIDIQHAYTPTPSLPFIDPPMKQNAAIIPPLLLNGRQNHV